MTETEFETEDTSSNSNGSHRAQHSFGGWVRWLVRPRLTFGGLVVGLWFALWSLSPSLLPRGWVTQSVVTGIAAVCGYGIGSGLSAALRRWVVRREPSPLVKRRAWMALGAISVIGLATMLWKSRGWQDELRTKVGLEPDPALTRAYVVVVAAVVAVLVLFISRLVRSGTRALIRPLNRVVPPRVSMAVGSFIMLLLIVGFAQGVLARLAVSTMQSMFSTIDHSTREGMYQPTNAERSGGPGSVVDWDELGFQGRNFIGSGPRLAELESFGGDDCCEEPIRVYVGLAADDSLAERARLAVEELERTGAFEREVLVLFTATGTGYINPYAADAIEYLYGGDTALVAMQYSYLPSWITVLIDDEPPGDTTRAMWDAVMEHLDEMDPGDRPTVLGFGESLGSFGLERGLETVEEIQTLSDGALLIGPTYDNPLRQELTRHRVEGSPEWQPKPSVPGVFFAQEPADLPGPPSADDPPRIVYLQNASDPVTWWNWGLWALEPDWNERPYAVDRSPAFGWRPVVAFWQIVGDLPGAGEVPAGHGHIFGENVVDGWLAVRPPEGWVEADTARLRDLLRDNLG